MRTSLFLKAATVSILAAGLFYPPQIQAQAAENPLRLLAYWDFNDTSDPEVTRDVLHGFEGVFESGAAFSDDAEGRTGQAGDRAIHLGFFSSGELVRISDAGWLNVAGARDQMSVSMWIHNYDIVNSSAFWMVSPSSPANFRGAQAHTPWGSEDVVFDTAGCCNAATQRIAANINTFPDYFFGWWFEWRHFVFIKNGAQKQIWIDGELFLEGQNTLPLPSDFTQIVLGAEWHGINSMAGWIDDFAVFAGALDEAQIQSLANGESPLAIAGDVPPPPPVPQNLEVTGASALITSISWDPAGPASEVFYDLERDGEIIARFVTSTVFHDTTVEPETAYAYRVRSVGDALQTSEFSQEAAALTQGLTEVSGLVSVEYYLGIGAANSVDALREAEKFPDNPDFTVFLPIAEIPVNWADNYGTRMRGHFIPPETGGYVFFISADDNAELYLSADSSFDNLRLIAIEPVWTSPRSWVGAQNRDEFFGPENRSDSFFEHEWPEGDGAGALINLQAGQRYAFEALHKEGGGGDHLGLNFKLRTEPDPENETPSRLTGSVISALANDPENPGIDIIRVHPASQTALEMQTATFNVEVDPSINVFRYQWMRNGAIIPDAHGSSYTTGELSIDDDDALFRVVVAIPGATIYSEQAVLSVQPDVIPPALAAAAGTENLAGVLIRFSKPVTRASAETIANYEIPGLTVQSAGLSQSGQTVFLTTTPQTSGTEYTARVSNVRDTSAQGSLIAPGSEIQFTAGAPLMAGYRATVLQDEPLLYFAFEETEPTEAVNLGTLGAAGNATYTFGFTLGEPGPRPPHFAGFDSENTAASFIWDEEYVQIEDSLLSGLSAFTMSGWIHPDELEQNRIGLFGQNDAIEFGFINPTTIQIWTPNGGSLSVPYTFPYNEWRHIATVGDGSALRIYFDGELAGEAAASTQNYGISDDPLNIGGGGVFDASGNQFFGQIDEVAIWTRALSAEQIMAHYQAGVDLVGLEVSPPTGQFTGIQLQEGNVVITWEGPGTLQVAPEVTGTWQNVPGSPSSPYTVPVEGPRAFYRLQTPAP
jgi:hypothetical protein